jgi:hypothetical protein
MGPQTVTRALETDLEPSEIYKTLADVSLIPKWAPVFADAVEEVDAAAFRVTKGSEAFNVELHINESALTVDYLRGMSNGRKGGAFIRVSPKPLGGCVVTMTVPVGPDITPDQVAATLEQELDALVKLTAAS